MHEVITVYTRTIWIATLPVAALICMSAWGQTSSSDGGHAGPTPSGAATARTPSTSTSGDSSDPVSLSPRQIAALKKQAEKDSRKNAAAADAAKAASSAPPK
jgi:hypothetical protein